MKKSIPATRFGLYGLISAILSVIALTAFYGIVFLDLEPRHFFRWNNILAGAYCLTTPAAAVFGALGLLSAKDSKRLAWTALGLTVLPFAILFVRFVDSVIRANVK